MYDKMRTKALGWLSIRAYIAILKIMFMIRLLCMPAQNVYRKIMVHQLNIFRIQNFASLKMDSPVMSMYKAAKYYGLDIMYLIV